jgi:ABC-type sugar transport system substrate-binding protein
MALLTASLATLLASQAGAATIGVSMQSFDDNFQTLLRNGLTGRAAKEGVEVQLEDAQRDVGKQLSQIQNFIATGVDAIIVTLVDTSVAPAITSAAEAAGIPLVYLNLEPVNLAKLPDNQAYIGSKEAEAGMLGGAEACRLLAKEGKQQTGARAYIVMGDLSHNAALERTQSVRDALSTKGCDFVEVVDAQPAGWLRTNASDLMTNWLTTGEPFDAVFANNDEMAIGAAQAMKSAGVDMKKVIVVGVDATQDGLAAMKTGDLDVTVFQNATGQAAGAVDAALALARRQAVDRVVYIPFELVTPENMATYAAKN